MFLLSLTASALESNIKFPLPGCKASQFHSICAWMFEAIDLGEGMPEKPKESPEGR